jgi:hypothetical protein
LVDAAPNRLRVRFVGQHALATTFFLKGKNMSKEITLIGRSTINLPSGVTLEDRDYGAELHTAGGKRKYILRLHETADLRDAPRIDVTELVRTGRFLPVNQ